MVFRVVNGTFTENGGTEILKMYEVGSIIDSVPAVRADRGYRSRRWDRDPIGRTVEPGGMTFVLTFAGCGPYPPHRRHPRSQTLRKWSAIQIGRAHV